MSETRLPHSYTKRELDALSHMTLALGVSGSIESIDCFFPSLKIEGQIIDHSQQTIGFL